MCDPKIRGRDDSQNRTVRGFLPRWQIYVQVYFLGRLPLFHGSSFLSIFFFSPSFRPASRGFAQLNNEKQHEQLTTSLGGGRICAYRVISYTPPRLFIPLRLPLLPRCTARIENFPSPVTLLILHDRRHRPLVPRLILRDRRHPLSSLYVLFYAEDGGYMCMCVYVCICAIGYFPPVSCFFFPFFGKGLHRVSRYANGTTRPLENSTFLWLLHPIILSLLHSALRRSLSIRFVSPFDVPPPSTFVVRVTLTSYTFVS